MKKGSVLIGSILMAVFFFVGTALAHVEVTPNQGKAGTVQKYVVSVPSEKNINTTEVKLEFPEGVTIETISPLSGWTSSYHSADVGGAQSIVWKATSGGIKPQESVDFIFVAKNPNQPGQIHWDATQTYQDGSVVHWNGPEGSDYPASVTTIAPASAINPPAKGNSPQLPLQQRKVNAYGFGIAIAIVISIFALIISILSYLKMKRR